MFMSTDTIAAIGTALQNSGISIIRISGKDSLNIINKIFISKAELKPNTIIYGKIYDNNTAIDRVLVSYFKAPKSFTGEDVCEINCHGGIEITRQILEIVLENGARLALPGEFSKRAFLNGKMDLSQAEAVINLINAKNKLQTQIATNQLEGNISKKIASLREELVELLAHIEVSVDYPEYDYEEVENDNVISLIDKKVTEIKQILDTYEQGKYIKDGVNVAIIGRPNVGKSSLLNNLSKSDKAIVTDIAGTTRDIVEETINIGSLVLNIYDTAGIRDTENLVEKIGVEKSLKKLDEVDLVLFLLNGEEGITDDELKLLSKIKNKGLKVIVAINKIDKTQKSIFDTILNELNKYQFDNVISLSVINNEGIENLKKAIDDIFSKSNFDYSHELVITNARHKDLLKKAVEYLEQARTEVNN